MQAPDATSHDRPLAVSAPSDDPAAAVATLAAAFAALDPALVLVFASPAGAVPAIVGGLHAALGPGPRVVGCSSAGEIGPGGYCSDTVTAIAFPRAQFGAGVTVMGSLQRLPVSDWIADLRANRRSACRARKRGCFGVLLADGLSRQEEVIVAALDAALPDVPVIGGSAGDGLAFAHTCLAVDDQVLVDAAVLCLIETDLRIEEVVFAHFRPTDRRMVVTDAAPEDRLILELNAVPAAEEYARMVGVPTDALSPVVFAKHPLMMRMGGRFYVRAISEATPQGGLKLMSAIEAGSVLTLGVAGDPTGGLETLLTSLPGNPSLVLTFDCILRRLAVEHAGLAPEMAVLARRFNMAGFNTYGEQHGGMHVNQTLVGLAFLSPDPENAAG